MLTQEVLVEQGLRHRVAVAGEHLRVEGHHGDFFKHDGIVDGVQAVRSPAEGAVILDENSGHIVGIDAVLLEAFYRNDTGVVLVFALDFRLGHIAGTRNLAVEIVALRRAIGAHALSGLGKDCRPARMGMHDTADMRKFFIEDTVSLGVRGRIELLPPACRMSKRWTNGKLQSVRTSQSSLPW